MASLTPFDHLKNLTELKVELAQDSDTLKSYNEYMINRFISMEFAFLPLVNNINRFPHIPKSAHYDYYLNALPKKKTYFNYIKKPKEGSKVEFECIMKYYECGKKDAEDYLNMLTDEQLKTIVKKYDGGQI